MENKGSEVSKIVHPGTDLILKKAPEPRLKNRGSPGTDQKSERAPEPPVFSQREPQN
jgi:hypothetical protein